MNKFSVYKIFLWIWTCFFQILDIEGNKWHDVKCIVELTLLIDWLIDCIEFYAVY